MKRLFKSAHPAVIQMMNSWLAARDGGDIPRKAAFDPLSIAPLLPNVWLYRYDPDRSDFVCQLSGEAINDAWGGSIKGATLARIVGPEYASQARARWRAILETPHVQYGVLREDPEAPQAAAERLASPLADESGAPTYVIGLSIYPYRQTDRDRTPPVWPDVHTFPCSNLRDLSALPEPTRTDA